MITTIAMILAAFWAIGVVTGSTLGGFIHLLLVVAVAMVLVRFIRSRSTT